jgi:hypothetical protein
MILVIMINVFFLKIAKITKNKSNIAIYRFFFKFFGKLTLKKDTKLGIKIGIGH